MPGADLALTAAAGWVAATGRGGPHADAGRQGTVPLLASRLHGQPHSPPLLQATVHTYTMDKLQPFDLGQASFLESIVDLLLADSEGDTGRAAS